jgi:hypothetical protein
MGKVSGDGAQLQVWGAQHELGTERLRPQYTCFGAWEGVIRVATVKSSPSAKNSFQANSSNFSVPRPNDLQERTHWSRICKQEKGVYIQFQDKG